MTNYNSYDRYLIDYKPYNNVCGAKSFINDILQDRGHRQNFPKHLFCAKSPENYKTRVIRAIKAGRA